MSSLRRHGLLLVIGLTCFFLGGQTAKAVILTDLNSTVDIDPTTSAGMFNWTVDGTDHLAQQWFWYRVGSTGGEQSIDTLSAPTVAAVGNIATITYAGSGLNVQVSYLLTGGTAGSGTSDVAETIRIINTGNAAIDLHFFQYSDFDLNGTALNDVGWLRNTNTVDQAEAGFTFSESVATPAPNHHEINTFPNTLNSLNDGNPTTLSDLPPVYTVGSSDFVVGDVTWAFQWDTTLGVGDVLIISKDKHLRAGSPDNGPLVPEPASLAVWGGLSVLGLVFGSRFRRRGA